MLILGCVFVCKLQIVSFPMSRLKMLMFQKRLAEFHTPYKVGVTVKYFPKSVYLTSCLNVGNGSTKLSVTSKQTGFSKMLQSKIKSFLKMATDTRQSYSVHIKE